LSFRDWVLAPEQEGGAAALGARSEARDPLLKCLEKLVKVGRDGVILSLPGTHLLGEIRVELGRGWVVTLKTWPMAYAAADVMEYLFAGEFDLPAPLSE
jgi:hypothetical protein